MGKKRNLIIIGIVAAVVLVGGAIWAGIASLDGGSGEEDPYRQTTSVPTENTQPESEQDTTITEEPQVEVEEVTDPDIDPATVSTIDIAPMDITVSYIRGVPGFEYLVHRTSSSLQYVAFSSPELVGTKCTDDEGVFATIIEDPESDADRATLAKTKTIGSKTYGLSLPEETCTKDADLFRQYQDSFEDAFGLLKALDTADE